MQIEIDFEVFKALTALRQSEVDSYNQVIRRLLKLPPLRPPVTLGEIAAASLAAAPRLSEPLPTGLFGVGLASLPQGLSVGAWFSGAFLPEGTQLRATYKGSTYFAEIKNGRWIGRDGVVRTSPSEAASAISRTNVNGWRFWHFLTPGETEWHRLDELKQ